jgi:hypothetical protein
MSRDWPGPRLDAHWNPMGLIISLSFFLCRKSKRILGEWDDLSMASAKVKQSFLRYPLTWWSYHLVWQSSQKSEPRNEPGIASYSKPLWPDLPSPLPIAAKNINAPQLKVGYVPKNPYKLKISYTKIHVIHVIYPTVSFGPAHLKHTQNTYISLRKAQSLLYH